MPIWPKINRSRLVQDGLSRWGGGLPGERERLGLGTHLAAQALTKEQIQSLQEFAAVVAQGLKVAEGDFDTRQRIVAMLDVQAILTMEDGKSECHPQRVAEHLGIPKPALVETLFGK